MEVLVAACAGLDVHQKMIMACVRKSSPSGEVHETVQEFGATTPDLLALRDWLESEGVTQVAMEATGVYWKPPYYVLEDGFEVLLVNPRDLKHVPGHKSDVIDCRWIAQLLSYGLLKPSFVPPPPIRDLRDLTRYRKVLVRDRVREVSRLHKVLEDAGVKLTSVASDALGVSGRLMIQALIDGYADPSVLADLAKGRLRAKLALLEKALTGNVRDHHRFLLQRMFRRIVEIEADIEAISVRMREVIGPFEAAVRILCSIPGVAVTSAEVILAEIGADMKVFPTEKHLASWAKIAPGTHESAGKHKRVGIGQGSPWLRAALLEAAWAATHTKDTYLAELFRTIRRRSGKKVAIVAVAHEILVAAWRLLSHGEIYDDPGPTALHRRTQEQLKRRAVRQLEALGYTVDITPAAA